MYNVHECTFIYLYTECAVIGSKQMLDYCFPFFKFLHICPPLQVYLHKHEVIIKGQLRTFNNGEGTPLHLLPAAADEPFIDALHQFSQMIWI